MTSVCHGYNHNGNSNYIIERVAAKGTLLITQCFQLLEAALLQINWSSKACTLLLSFRQAGTAHQYCHKSLRSKYEWWLEVSSRLRVRCIRKVSPCQRQADSLWSQLFVTYFCSYAFWYKVNKRQTMREKKNKSEIKMFLFCCCCCCCYHNNTNVFSNGCGLGCVAQAGFHS